MIRLFTERKKDAQPFVLLGLTDVNLEKLKAGKPIMVELDPFGVPATCAIVYGESEEKIYEELVEVGLVGSKDSG